MMQPVLTYGANYGQGNRVWGMSNWFTDCPKSISASGYCHDKYQAVNEGDTIHFSMQYQSTDPTTGWQTWAMQWQALNSGQSSTFEVEWEHSNVETIWST